MKYNERGNSPHFEGFENEFNKVKSVKELIRIILLSFEPESVMYLVQELLKYIPDKEINPVYKALLMIEIKRLINQNVIKLK